MQKLRILYAATEIFPFLQTSSVAEFLKNLAQSIQERDMEIRILVPRFGLINERKNRLHEVVRLSGINIPIGDEEKPLVIKVASIPNAKLQVYFIDNEDYFQRKSIFTDKNEKFHEDNDDRAIFFCKGVLETVKKLGWAPDIVHCNDWMTSLIPLYIKTRYKNDPIFKNTKSVFSVYDNYFSHKFDENIAEKAKMLDVDDSMVESLKEGDFGGFIKVGAEYADTVIKSSDNYSKKVQEILQEVEKQHKNVETLDANEESVESYYNLYNELAVKDELAV